MHARHVGSQAGLSLPTGIVSFITLSIVLDCTLVARKPFHVTEDPHAMSLATVDTQLISQIQAIMWKLTSDGTCSNQPLIARLSILYAYSSVAVVCHSSSVSSCPMTDVVPPPREGARQTGRVQARSRFPDFRGPLVADLGSGHLEILPPDLFGRRHEQMGSHIRA